MCMSTAYQIRDGENNLILEHVLEAETLENEVRLTDLLGNQKVVPGFIRSIDLNKNVILIEA